MRTHYCRADRDWITFEGVCSWCGVREEDVGTPMSDAEFRKLMAKMEAAARPDINDD